jgi:hypothetical protein
MIKESIVLELFKLLLKIKHILKERKIVFIDIIC